MKTLGTVGSAAAQDNARGVRRTATAILGGLLAVFIATSLPGDPPTWVLLLRAMAEAGMVGGLADWFAVEALFRRPLGLPIPHTALLPRNQKRAATNIARFIDEYFMAPDQLLGQIRAVDPLRSACAWLSRTDNARIVGREVAWGTRMLVHAQVEGEVPGPLRELVSDTVRQVARSDQLSGQIGSLLKGALDTEILDEVLLRVRETIDENRPAIARLVQDRSRWWIAKGVDLRVAELIVDGVLSVLDELRDAESPRRHAFARTVSGIIERFEEDGTIKSFLADSVAAYETSRDFDTAINDLIRAVLRQIDGKLAGDPSAFEKAMTDAIQRIARHLHASGETRAAIEERLEQALLAMFAGMRAPVRDYVARTIDTWDSAELVARIEAEVGRDLQFIRINGAVLGSILGGILFAFSHLVL